MISIDIDRAALFFNWDKMLSQLSDASFAVVPATHDTLTFVDANSNISRLGRKAEGERILGYKAFDDRVLIWSNGSNTLNVKKSTGEEEKIANLDNIVSLSRLGEDSYCAYCEGSETSSIIHLAGDKLDQRETVLTRKRKIKDESEAGPTAFCWDEQWSCSVITRRRHVYVIRQKAGSKELAPLVSFRTKQPITCIAVALKRSPNEDGDVTICVGTPVGKIFVYRIDKNHSQEPVVSELHWHANIVRTLSLIDDDHLISGGEEGVIVLWRLDRGMAGMTFRPRLGAAIIDSIVMRPMSSQQKGEGRPSNCVLLLDDGCALEVEVPSLVLLRRIRTWIPNRNMCVVPVCVNDPLDASSRYLAVALDNHRRGALTFIDADLRDSTAEERVVDVANRNAVSTADKQSQWTVNEVCFSPNGTFLASLLSSGLKKRELRIFYKDQEVLRVPMSLLKPGADVSSKAQKRKCLSVTNKSVAVVDPNAPGNIIIFTQSQGNGDFAIERVLDVDPQVVACVALSDDESCLGAMTSSGAIRVWNRVNGEIALAYGVKVGEQNEGGMGLGFSRGSKELFVWTPTEIYSMMQGVKLSVDHLIYGSVSPALDRVVFVKKDGSKGGRSVWTWTGNDVDEVKVEQVESSDWKSVEWAGRTIGWLLLREDGSVHTRGGVHSFVPKRHGEKTLPALNLHIAVSSADRQKSEQKRNLVRPQKIDSSSLYSTEWCKDLPSHILQKLPPVEIVWPSNAESNLRGTQTQSGEKIKRRQTTDSTNLVHLSRKKRKALEAEQEKQEQLIVEPETEEERALIMSAFKSLNGISK